MEIIMSEIDLEQFIQVLDHALATDDPKIKKALKKFLFIAALAMEGDPEPGPFTAMFEEMDDLRRRIKSLEDLQTQKMYDYTDYTYTNSGTPTWKYGGGTSTSGTVTIPTTTTTTGGTVTNTGTITSGGCTGFTAPTTSTWSTLGYTINLGDDEKGKRIKEELQQKLGTLTK